MTEPLILDGRKAAEHILLRLKTEVDVLRTQNQRPPGLAVLQIGDNPASEAYIRQKKKAAEGCGFYFVHHKLARSSPKHEISSQIKTASEDPLIDGILLQLPLDSSHSFSAQDISELLETIPASMDADGLHPYNLGKLFCGESTPGVWTHPIPATPLGIYRLMEHYNICPAGLDITVIGKSRLVGLPAAVIMTQQQATVTSCNRLTARLEEKTRTADIVIAAAGTQHLVTPAHLKEGAIVIDVGIHVDKNKKLSGDVSPDCYKKLKAYSPVPGGVGPMTVASLMENTLRLRLSKRA